MFYKKVCLKKKSKKHEKKIRPKSKKKMSEPVRFDLPFDLGGLSPTFVDDLEGHETLTREEQKQFVDSLAVTLDDISTIMAHAQRSDSWLGARKGRMTGSIAGAVVGHNFFSKPTDQLKELLWNTFTGNEATQWGTDHEAEAAACYEAHTKYKVTYTGLVVNEEKPWFAYSPDGIVEEDENGQKILLEIKCPFKKKLYPSIPMCYYDQIQYGCHMLGCAFADFFVWTPDQCRLERYAYNKEYCTEFLIPTLERFYFDRFLPLYILKHRGLLPSKSVTVPKGMIVEPMNI